MELFTEQNGVIFPTDEAKEIYPFSLIWSRDNTPHKDRAHADYKFIQFMTSPKSSNPFFGYSDLRERAQKIIDNIHKEFPEWQPDNLLREAVNKRDEFFNEASPTLSFYNAALTGANKLRDFFLNFDMEAKNLRTGAPIYKPAEITRALADTSAIMTNLNNLRKTVDEELFSNSKVRRDRPISKFER